MANVAVFDVRGLTDPDMGTVCALARLAVAARRYGCTLVLDGATADLRDLLMFAGLGDAVPCSAREPER